MVRSQALEPHKGIEMPCYKCSNGKWKYGEHGNCQFDTLAACREAEQAIHARENPPKKGSKMPKKDGKKQAS